MPNKVLTVIMPSDPVEVLQIKVPGQQGPGGVPGPAGPSSVLSMGTVTTGAPGSNAAASLSGVSPNQTLNITIPRGNTGDAGPASNLAIGTITTSLPGSNGAASITGTAPNFVLNLTLPRGYGVPTGGTANQVLAKLSSNDYDTGWVSYTASNTNSTLVLRDSAGRAQVADPSAAQDISTKNYTDTQVATRAATSHTHTASQISDSTTTGRSVVTATDAAAARSAIGAGTSSLTLGTSNTTAKAGDYQPTAANISDSTATGRSVLTATDAAAARSAIGAGTSSLVVGTTSTTAKAGDYSPPAATESISGISRFATSAETATGTATNISVHPAGLAAQLTTFGRDRGSGSALPNVDLRRGDTYYHVNWTCLYVYNGSAWRQVETPTIATINLRNNYTTSYSNALYSGFRIYVSSLLADQVWNGTFWDLVDTRLPTMRVFRSSGANYNTASYLVVPFDSLDSTNTYNPDEEWFTALTSLSERRILVKRAGEYLMTCNLTSTVSSTTFTRIVTVPSANTADYTFANQGGNSTMNLSVRARLSANTYVGATHYSPSGGDVADGSSGFRSDFTISRVGS